jgi:alkanesulfonate monooxygenase SsuD/methylene tetrahydromethanopterin reductase-like flavin-dependent oxidoreductase (luciferase family)
MGPKAMRRAAAWADGVYVFSMSGDPAEIRNMFDLAERAWAEAGRSAPPRRIAGFWYSLADDAPRKLHDYVYQYLEVFGEASAQAIAKTMKCHDAAAIADSAEKIAALGCDELILSPASADLNEISRLTELISN